MNNFITNVFPFILLFAGFLFLIKGASIFVDYSSKIAKQLGVSQLFIALTIVAMGTSIPETAVSLLAAINGNTDLSIGNIVGTNTLNILLILGITAVLTPLRVKQTTLCYETPIMLLTAIIFSLLGLGFSLFTKNPVQNGSFSRVDGVIFMLLFLLYLLYLAWLARKSRNEKALVVIESKIPWLRLISFLIIGLGLIIFGSNIVVKGASQIAQNFGVSERIIGLTIVAFATSLPELATSITAALKGHDDLAVGNIVGSNIYNMLFIGGLTALVSPIPYSSSFHVDSLICIAASLLLLILLMNKNRVLSRFAGSLMLLLYGCNLWYLLKTLQ